ncbi:MAG: glucosamine-6-phosphate deaminase [Mycoplasmoidaceae bacterium]
MEIKYFLKKEKAFELMAKIIIEKVIEKPNVVLGLATGGTFEKVYENVICLSKIKNVNFSKVFTFNLDEYVNLKQELYKNSYHFYMDNNLFNFININHDNIHFPCNFQNNYNSGELFQDYDKKIHDIGGIEIQLLGLGANGHIGFNEPGSKIDSITRCIELSHTTIKDNSRYFQSINDVPKKAVTMGLKTIIDNSKMIYLLAFGENKRDALKRLIDSKGFDPNYPVTILKNFKNLIIFTDLKFN